MKAKIYKLGKSEYAISNTYQVFRKVRKKWSLLESCKSFDQARLYIFRVAAVDKGMETI